MKNWAIVYLITAFHTATKAQVPCPDSSNGEVRIIGISASNIVAGRIELCKSDWTAVCDDGWDFNDARVVCRQLGFPIHGTLHCTNSCFGRSNLTSGIRNFECPEEESLLNRCWRSNSNRSICAEFAGVLCSTQPGDVQTWTPDPVQTWTPDPVQTWTPDPVQTWTPDPVQTWTPDPVPPTIPAPITCPSAQPPEPVECPTCPTCTVPSATPGLTVTCPSQPMCTNSTWTVPSTSVQGSSTESTGASDGPDFTTYVAIGLGTLAAVLALILVGVAFGWMCSRSKVRARSNVRNNRTTSHTNPTSVITPNISYAARMPVPYEYPLTVHPNISYPTTFTREERNTPMYEDIDDDN